MLLKYRYTILISRLWSGRHFPESRHVVDSTLFHIALCANQFRVWNRYHIMTPVYVSVIYFISFFYLFYFFCIRSLVRHLPSTSTGCFRLALFGKPRHWGQSECSSLIGWFLDMVYFQQWSRTESKTPHVTLLGRSYWISYIHHQIKKDKRNLFTPSAIFFVTKFHIFAIMSKATSQAFSSYRRTRTVLSFRERYRLTVFVSNGTVAVMAQRGVSLKSVLTCYEKNKMIFSLSEQ